MTWYVNYFLLFTTFYGIFILRLTDAFRIRLYYDIHHRGLFYEDNVSIQPPSCINLPNHAINKTGSLRTTACVMIYDTADCTGYSMKVTQKTGKTLGQFTHKLKSFQPCSEEDGGTKINVDLYSDKNREGLILEYHDICECIDLPSFAYGKVSSLNNHGNCIKLYEEEGCRTWNTVEIPGGRSEESEDLAKIGFYGFDDKTKSIGPCDDRPACLVLNATVFKFEVYSDPHKVARLSKVSSFQMSAKATFRNNGSATVSQEYSASKTIQEAVTVERTKSMTTLNKVTVESGVTVESKIPIIGSTSVTASLSMAYKFESNETEEESQSYVHSEEREFFMKERIEIPPCTLYEVSSSIRVMENYPVEYTVFSKITGESGGEALTATRMRAVMEDWEDLEWVEDEDEFTVIMKGGGSMIADFGVDTMIEGEGVPIRPCCLREEGS